MVETRTILLVGGPDNATAQNRLDNEATAFIEDKQRAALLTQQLVITISFRRLLAVMNNEIVGPCQDALSILNEIEATSV